METNSKIWIKQQEAEKQEFLRKAGQESIDSAAAGEVDFALPKPEARQLLAAMQASSHRDVDVEPSRNPMPVREVDL